MFDLCAVGDLKWLIILSVSYFPRQGEMTFITKTERQIGNDASIVALLASRLGMRCRLLPTNAIARHDGSPLLDLLQQNGVDISQIDTNGTSTPNTFCLLPVDADERTWLVEDCPFRDFAALDRPADYRFAYLDLYEEYLEERLALLNRWSQSNVRCLVNLSSSHLEEKLQRLAQLSSVDIIQMRGSGSIKEAIAWGRHVLQTCRARATVITLGSSGAVLLDQHNEHVIPAEPIQPLRTVSAGASFAAGLLYALSNGSSYLDAATFASKHAASFCTSGENPVEVKSI
ncbi:MAG TPA: carbohydrate kinase family protein [Ktedonobacteraceae bacterium]|jgi:sugar/nucleoside kinase (ribokinase family)|nr:carbohydrate kinase family protein [Ktedonobacteraceae bacterium]